MSEIVSSLPDDYATVERPVAHRDTILRLTMDSYVKRYGPDAASEKQFAPPEVRLR